MDEEGSISNEKTWGFRRSTIARREFLEAVGTVLNSPPAPLRVVRQSRGRGRGRGRGKHVNEAGAISAAPKRGRGGRRHTSESVLAPAEEKSNEDEACGVTDGPQFVVAELKLGEKSFSEETISDRAEDSDDLSLQEIRKRAISRRLEELGHEDDVKDTEYAAGDIQLVEQEDVNMLDGTDVSSNKQIALSSSARGDSENYIWKGIGGQTAAKRAKLDSAEEESTDYSKEASEKTDVLCCICQQTIKERFLICCEACRKWHHTDCAGISEAHGRLLQKNEEQYICSTCSEDDNITRKIRNANKISTFTAIVAETMEEQKSKQHVIKLEEKVNEVKEEIKILEEVKDALPKCIGPGCSNNALPGSVYCGHRCIVQHAAVAMKCLSEAKPETKPALLPTKPLLQSQKRSFLAKLFKVKTGESPTCEEKASTQEMVKEESVGCTEVTDPEQQPSAATVEDKPRTKTKLSEVRGE